MAESNDQPENWYTLKIGENSIPIKIYICVKICICRLFMYNSKLGPGINIQSSMKYVPLDILVPQLISTSI